jgi:hypothetical protein
MDTLGVGTKVQRDKLLCSICKLFIPLETSQNIDIESELTIFIWSCELKAKIKAQSQIGNLAPNLPGLDMPQIFY